MIKAIETRYKGYRFRSRLEARWAVFFDSIGWPIEWEYEPEGFNLGNGVYYLPDFKINYGVHYCYVEIKAKKPTREEFEKGKRISFDTKKPFYFLCQIPNPESLRDAGLKIDGWCFIPANCDFMLSDGHFYMFEYFLDTLPEFLNCNKTECFSLDNQHYYKKYGKEHPKHCDLGRLSEIGIDIPFFMMAARNDYDYSLRKASEKARSARFEHGEKP